MGGPQPLISGETKNWVFDLDGTLIDSLPGIGSALRAAFHAVGREMPMHDLSSAIGPPISVIAMNLDRTLSSAQAAEIERTYRSLYDEDRWRETTLFPGVRETLRELCLEGCRLFIVTNKPAKPSARILVHLELRHLFEDVVSRDSRDPSFTSKAEMLADLVFRYSLNPNATTMVGDTMEDRNAAQANTIHFIHAAYGYGHVPAGGNTIEQFDRLEARVKHEV